MIILKLDYQTYDGETVEIAFICPCCKEATQFNFEELQKIHGKTARISIECRECRTVFGFNLEIKEPFD